MSLGSHGRRPVVYYMTSSHRGVVKIGTTVDLESRLRRFNQGRGVQCHVIAHEPGGPSLERERHRQFADAYLIGEWYWLPPDLVSHIKSLGGAL